MKNSKKIIALTMVMIMVILSVMGCQNKAPASTGDNKASVEDTAKNSNAAPAMTNEIVIPDFKAKDMDGKEVTQEIFKEHAATVVNLWFTGCHACVQEMPSLEKLSQDLKAKNVNLISICVDLPGSTKAKETAAKIIQEKGMTFPVLETESGKGIDEFLDKIVVFPTTLIVDSNGKVVVEPIEGSIDSQEQLDSLMKIIDSVVGGQA